MKQISIVTTAVITMLFSCKTGSKEPVISISAERSIDPNSGSCPYLTRDNNNNLVLSWIKQVDSAVSVLSYAISRDEGKSFGKAIDIPGSTNVHPHGENMPKIIFKKSGEIIAVWGAANPNPNNQYSGLVYYSQSFDEGQTWSIRRRLTADSRSFDQRYFDVALLPNGEAGIVWLDNRKQWKGEGSGLFYAATKGGAGFGNEKLISGPCCQCCRTDLFVDRNSNIHVLYRAIINDSIRDIVHIVSTDDARTFNEPKRVGRDDWVISGCPHTGPAMTENNEGLHFTWFTGSSTSGIYYTSSADNGKTFTGKDSVSGKSAKHCQLTTLPNNNILIVWNESYMDDNIFSNRIRLEERDATGHTIFKHFITGAKSQSSFPVIVPVTKNKVVIAYTESINGRNQVLYKQVTLQD